MKPSIISCNSNFLLDQICTFSGWNIHFSWWRSLVLLFSNFLLLKYLTVQLKFPCSTPESRNFLSNPFEATRSRMFLHRMWRRWLLLFFAVFLNPQCYMFSVVEPQNFGSLNPLECKLRVQPHIFACLGSEIHMLNRLHNPTSSNIEENALFVYNLSTKNADYPASHVWPWYNQWKMGRTQYPTLHCWSWTIGVLGPTGHRTGEGATGTQQAGWRTSQDLCPKKRGYHDIRQRGNLWSESTKQMINPFWATHSTSVSSNRKHVLPCFCDVCFLRDHEFQTAQGSCESCAGGRAMWCSLNSHHCLVQSWHRTWQAQATPPKTEAEGNQRTRFRH